MPNLVALFISTLLSTTAVDNGTYCTLKEQVGQKKIMVIYKLDKESSICCIKAIEILRFSIDKSFWGVWHTIINVFSVAFYFYDIRMLMQITCFFLFFLDVTEPLLVEVDQIYHLACPASPIFYKYNPVKVCICAMLLLIYHIFSMYLL